MTRAPRSVTSGVFVVPSSARLISIANTQSFGAVWRETGKCLAYPKPDGWRLQVHRIENEIRLFTRSGVDWSRTFGSFVKELTSLELPRRIVLDAELIGFDGSGRHVQPSRLQTAAEHRCCLLDLLYVDGADLTKMSTEKRVAELRRHFGGSCCEWFALAEYHIIDSVAELQRLYESALARRGSGFDGVIVKDAKAPYFVSALKLKPEETVDAVVVGAYSGADGDVGSLLLAVPNRRGRWIPVARVAKTNVDWKDVWPACSEAIVAGRPQNVAEPPEPVDVWIEPKVVVAVKMRWISKSAGYASGVKLEAVRSCSLRPDKGPGEATPFEEMANIVGQPEAFEQPSLLS